MVKDCIFCDILSGKLPVTKLYEDEKILIFMDIQPINSGHLLIIPKEHKELITELDDNLVAHMFKLAQKMNFAVRDSGVKCEGVNYFLADGESAGQEVFHVHVHVIPRFKDDGFGFKFPEGYENKPSRENLETVAEKIKKVLKN
jgi:histidine triad (HIT) family protein